MAEGAQAALLIDESGNLVGIVLDGSTYRLEVSSKSKNTSGAFVDPATEGTLATLATESKLEAVRVLLNSLDGKDFATQTTLAAVNTRLGEVQDVPTAYTLLDRLKSIATLLTSIKDTDGVQIIDDIIRLGDTARNGINSVLNNSIRRLEMRGSVTSPDGTTDADVGTSATSNNRLSTTARLTDGTGWLGTIVNNAIRRLEARTSVTSPDGANDVAVQSIDGVQHLAAGKANIVDTNNSTAAQLVIDGEFTGTGTDVSQFATVAITIHSDEDSAVDGMKFEFSMNNSDWDDVYSFNLEADSSQTRRFQFPICARYFRVHYINGSTATTELRIQTLLQRNNLLTSIHRIEDVVKEDRSAQIVKAAIIAQREGATVQTFHPVQADISGNLKVTTIGTDVPSDPSALVLEFAKNGGSEDLLVNGSVTPVNFDIGPTTTDEVWSLREILLTFAADDFSFDGDSFGPVTKLTNGVDIEIIKDGVTTSVFMVHQNEDFLRVPGRTPLVNNTGPKDVLGAAIAFQGLVLEEATSDLVRVKVQDNLTSVKLQYLTATIFAVKVL
jgi:hypothetical protein